MAHLTLVGLSADKTRLLLVDDSGQEHTLAVDASLRAAMRGDPSRLGQLEIDMESALRPRDIQTRIRAGETPEVVARAAQTTVDKIMPFAAPVLAERAHTAERAQRASMRRSTGEPGGRTLGDAVASQLSRINATPDDLDWDAWKRADGKWTLTASYATSARKGTATFAFEPPGNFVVAEDDDALWLVGELAEPAPVASADDLAVRRRRLSAVGEDQLPIGEDALDLVADTEGDLVDPRASTADLSETAAAVRSAAHAAAAPETLGIEQPADAFLDQVFATQNPGRHSAVDEFAGEGALVDAASAVEPEVDDFGSEDAESDDAALHRRPVKKTRGRASVPSWDEIMFGGGKQD